MAAPAFKRVEELFHQAVALAPADRPAFLAEACAGDPQLRAAVEDLLRHDRDDQPTESFLVSPVARAAEVLRPTRPDSGLHATSPAEIPLPSIPGYEVLEERGRGGMGIVYKARHIGLNRLVALKMLLPDGPAAPELLARFRTEAEALARLHHPNIVPVYDVGECEGRPYFTMEYVAGPNLAEWLAGRPQDGAAAARLLEVLARTLHAVHQAGLIHRDLKPANILLAADAKPQAAPVPKITDFGLAKDQTAERKLTRSGTALGTPCYMAPEQARPRESPVGPAADLYALGAILYEMLTGRPPFDAETAAETIVQVLHDEPLSPARLRPRLPRDLVTICLKCLEKSPRRRYASAWELAEDLRRFQAGEPIRARPVGVVERSYRWCRRRPLVAGLLALSALLAVAFVIAVLVYEVRLSRALAESQARADREQRELVQLHVDRGVIALEEEEDTIAAAFQFTEALALEPAGAPDLNDRTRIATALRQSPVLLRRWSIGGPLRPGSLLGVALRPDGRSLALVGRDGALLVVDLGTEESRALLGQVGYLGAGMPRVAGRETAVHRLAFHPDGRLLLTEYAQGTVRLWDLTGRPATSLREFSARQATFAALSDDGRWLFTLDAGHRGEVCDVTTGAATAAPLNLRHGLKLAALSLDGRHVALVDPDNALTVWDVPAARAVGKPVALPRDVRRVALSPDGERALTTGSDRTAQVWQVRTGELRAAWSRLDSTATYAGFSPDGRLVLLGDGSGQARVWDVVTGHALTPPLGQGDGATWAGFGDGGKQVVTVGTDGAIRLWRLPPGPEVSAAPPGKESAVPDGQRRWLANGMVILMSRVGAGALRPPRPRRDDEDDPRTDRLVDDAVLAPDRRAVAVCEEDGTVRVWDATTGAARSPPLRHGGAVRYAAFSRDGGRLLTASSDRTARVWDAVTGEVLAPPLRHDRAIERVFFRADGDRACVVQEGGVLCTWDLTPDGRSIDELRALVRELAGMGGGSTTK